MADNTYLPSLSIILANYLGCITQDFLKAILKVYVARSRRVEVINNVLMEDPIRLKCLYKGTVSESILTFQLTEQEG